MPNEARKRLDITPTARQRYLAYMYQKFEKERFPPPEIDLENDITFFGNEPQSGIRLGYDQFFSYTKVYPLYDKRKAIENRGFMPDKWSNIHQQEKPPKPVPATTSQWYGRRPGYDPEINKYGRKNHIRSFFGKHIPLASDEGSKYTEEIINARL